MGLVLKRGAGRHARDGPHDVTGRRGGGGMTEEAEEDVAGRGAGGRVLGEALGGQAAKRLLDRAEVGLGVHDAVEDGREAVAAEGRLAGGGVDHRAGPGEHVGGGSGLFARKLLGRHVRGRADHHRGQRRGAVKGAGDAEVDDPRPVLAEQHVGRLEVPVHDARLVDRDQGGHSADGQAVQGRTVPWPLALDDGGQGGAVDVLADDEGAMGVDAGLDDLCRAERRHPLGDGDLPDEAILCLAVPREVGAEHLDRHR
ncbi:hypothetical protein ABH927_005140 [Planotetraspora sp. GP83]